MRNKNLPNEEQPSIEARQSKRPTVLRFCVGFVFLLPFAAWQIVFQTGIEKTIPEVVSFVWMVVGILLLILAVVGLFIPALAELSDSFNTYVLTPRTITHESGLFGRKTNVIRLADAIGVECKRSVWERLTSTGTVKITFTGGHWRTLFSIANADEFVAKISQAIDTTRS